MDSTSLLLSSAGPSTTECQNRQRNNKLLNVSPSMDVLSRFLSSTSSTTVDGDKDDSNEKQKITKRTNKRQRRRKRIASNNVTTTTIKFTVVLALTGWFGVLVYSHSKLHQAFLYSEILTDVETEFRVQRLREPLQQHTTTLSLADPSEKVAIVANTKPSTHSNHHNASSLSSSPRFLIFEGEKLGGQGAGNLMNGLLATHLLAEEYGRIVCVTPTYKSFHMAFEAIDPDAVQHCDQFFQDHPHESDGTYLEMPLINFRPPPDECMMQHDLASEQERIIYVQANTYPRWRSVPPKFFHKFYKPTSELLDVLPFDPEHPPSTVVHLRMQDGRSDRRKGLDDESLQELAKLLSDEEEPPYLVTNNVPYYDIFEPYGWTHPDWQRVVHSALKKGWGERKQLTESSETTEMSHTTYRTTHKIQDMQLWADWYSMIRAKKVYHTHSDFSLSAIHWMGQDPDTNEGIVWSRTLQDIDPVTGELGLLTESWYREEAMKPIVDRQGEELGNCRSGDKRSETKLKPKVSIQVSSKVQNDFMARHLALDDEAREQLQEYKREMGLPKDTPLNPMTKEEITSLVARAQKKRQAEWENKKDES